MSRKKPTKKASKGVSVRKRGKGAIPSKPTRKKKAPTKRKTKKASKKNAKKAAKPIRGRYGRFVARRSIEAVESAAATLRDALGPDWIDTVIHDTKFGYAPAWWSITLEGPTLPQEDVSIAFDSAAAEPTAGRVFEAAERVIIAVRLIIEDDDGDKEEFGWRTVGASSNGRSALYQSARELREEFVKRYRGELFIDGVEIASIKGVAMFTGE